MQARVDALSISESTPTLDTTVVGIGSLAGRGLMTLGEATLRGLQSVNNRLKLRTITAQLSISDASTISADVYDVLLELQRYVRFLR